jgi:hypothetical protein
MRAIMMSAAAIMFATAASADDSVMASRFGNTTLSTDASGVKSKLYYSADHTFTAKVGDQSVSGTWKVDGGTICLTYSAGASLPPTMPNPTCLPVVAHKVGDTWTTGEGAMKRTVTLVQGIQ